ncbi:hypothetical protein Lepto782_05380 [Leptospira interrogans serovar Canicola]|uniref:Uncharacterized protein n=1 Tax=Leptospira interrogans serovar Canicola TaxID=211880 RepID=A0AAP9W909_LEPIR|nr:hypothetical protein [Leptospira interrogans]QOI41757.1 hypothetical protein Lepto782_05380 [Leptospira interrogans serovar Canicola]
MKKREFKAGRVSLKLISKDCLNERVESFWNCYEEMNSREKRETVKELLSTLHKSRKQSEEMTMKLGVIAKIRSYTPFQLITKTVSCRDTYS